MDSINPVEFGKMKEQINHLQHTQDELQKRHEGNTSPSQSR